MATRGHQRCLNAAYHNNSVRIQSRDNRAVQHSLYLVRNNFRAMLST